MSIKSFIQLFVPPIFYKVKKRIFPKKECLYHPLPKNEFSEEKLIIIGNGPSLNKTMERYRSIIQKTPCLMVNYSATTPMYEDIKPRYYVMSDKDWLNEEDGPDFTSIKRCVSAIVNKTQWPMILVLPACFRNWWAIKEFNKNTNISVLIDESNWVLLPEDKLFAAFDQNRICPPSYTVLTYSLYLSLYWGYKETYLVGADTTFTQMVYVGQKDNLLYSVDTHFYDNKDVYPVEYEPERNGRRYQGNMESYTEMCYNVFYEYHLLARYAQWKGVKVYNASEFSMIDCFERKKLV